MGGTGGGSYCGLSSGALGPGRPALHPVSEPGDALAGPLPRGPSLCWFQGFLPLFLW